MPSVTEAVLFKDRHVKYWLRCAKTYLPTPYTPNDSNRMTLGCFIVSALDILDILEDKVTLDERDGWIQWIYKCQLAEGGFRGFPGIDLGDERRAEENSHWDPANVPASFFALVALLVLGDDLSRVRRKECLKWLPKLQRENGSCGETLGENGKIEGGNDLRFCCCAAGIRYILTGGDPNSPREGVDDLDVEKMVTYIASCQAYDGGFGEKPNREAHSGLTYCAIGALSFLNRIPRNANANIKIPDADGMSLQNCVRWILDRQTTYLEEEEEKEEDQRAESPPPRSGPSPFHDPSSSSQDQTVFGGALIPQLGGLSTDDESTHTALALSDAGEELIFVGFSGRPNKVADTCYCFWNTGALMMLGQLHLIESTGLRQYLLEKVQHVVGGFGKGVGDPPDVLHAYLGLVALSLIGEPGLQQVDARFCISQRARKNLLRVSWWTGNAAERAPSHSSVTERMADLDVGED